ncbi:palmitoyltransferase ZDHHC22-like [Gigantopelta aegis]|uniref:palmitoyltransferase ZDHHC22-like n=1 Tax=Gigantopelta aegis TaxID=1735272 RepID=UPI001B88A52F|nr:palmitoyltransferase ZDHHC22-like [Gigantopelta aegis]XP_041361128.1 palmitoyltransferase ZDHHC22-like [Gigantopelta aegis]
MEPNLLLARQTIPSVPQPNGYHSHDFNLQPKSLNPISRWKLQALNLGGIAYCMLYTLLSFIVVIKVTLPDVYASDENILFQRQCLAICLVSIMVANYAFVLIKSRDSIVGPSTASLPLFDPQLHQWKYCDTCRLHTPPRAKHCPICDHCVLKRDHHCFFAGCCVGFHNQRYFTVFCFYGSLSAIYSIYATGAFLQEHYASFFSSECYAYLLPWVFLRWLTGSVDAGTVGLVFHCYMSCMTFAACVYFFAWQCVLVWTGQSMYEFLKGIRLYVQPLPENLKSVFGSAWFLNFLIPCPWMKNKGNGIDWILSHDGKDK